MLYAANSGAENVCGRSIVIPELKLCDVQRQKDNHRCHCERSEAISMAEPSTGASAVLPVA
jgi:hypothetical protein